MTTGHRFDSSGERRPWPVDNVSAPIERHRIADGPEQSCFSLPPLGLLSAATSVTHNGDVYSFVVPRLSVGLSGWVAYAPLSHATLPLALTMALNTRADVVIKDGYVVSLAFPDGIRPLRGEALRFADWRISDIGTATLHGAGRSE